MQTIQNPAEHDVPLRSEACQESNAMYGYLKYVLQIYRQAESMPGVCRAAHALAQPGDFPKGRKETHSSLAAN